MGHLGNIKNEYYELSKRLDKNVVGFPEPENEKAHEGWMRILELLYTPEEAELGAKLPTFPASIEFISKHCGIKPEILKQSLNVMADKGIVMDLINPDTGEVLYSLSPPIYGFLELTMMKLGTAKVSKQELASALAVYGGNSEDFVREIHGSGKTALGRSVVYDSLIKEDLIPTVYDWERAVEIIEKAEVIAVSNCFCRHKAAHLGKACDAPVETCLSLDDFGEFVIRRNFGRKIDKKEALEILKDCEKHHLVHLVDNVKNRPAWLCNCCKCCCGALNAVINFGFPAVNPSNFKPKSLQENCKGCGLCTKVCPMGAISLKKDGDKNRIVIDEEKCIGCGICASSCYQNDIIMERCDTINYVPDSKIELLMLRAYDRGKLGQFVFDNGQQYGTNFLNLVIKVLSDMEKEDQKKALKQLDSKFVKYIVNNSKITEN